MASRRRAAANSQKFPENPVAIKDRDGKASYKPHQRTALGELSNRLNLAKITNEKKEIKSGASGISKIPSIIRPSTSGLNVNSQGIVEPKKVKTVVPQASSTVSYNDIDQGDFGNLFLVSEYVNDVYRHYRRLEDLYPIQPDFLQHQTKLSPSMRSIVVDWLISVHCQYHLLSETLYMAVSILDRYLQAGPCVSKDKFQLIGITSLFIASKYEETFPPDVSDYVHVCAAAYSKEELFEAEKMILDVLGFCLGRPVPIVFLRRYSKAAKSLQLHHAYAKYFMELALISYQMAHVKPSVIAAAALYMSHCVMQDDVIADEEFWSPTLIHYSGLKFSDISSTVELLAQSILKIHSTSLSAVHEKYATAKMLKVSLAAAVGPKSKILGRLKKLKE